MTRLRCLGLALALVALMVNSPQAEGHDATLSVGAEYTVKFLDVASDPFGDAVVSNGTIAFHGEQCASRSPACRLFVHNIITGETWDTGFIGTLEAFQYPYLVFEQQEAFLGDLDGDRYGYDRLLVVYDVVARSGHIVAENYRWSASLSDGRIAFNKVESYDQIDYNKDGDLFDVAVFLYDISERLETLAGIGPFPLLVGRHLVWYCEEANDLCSMDVMTHRILKAGLPWRYPNFDPTTMRNGDGDIIAISVLDEGDYDGNGVKVEYLLASFNMSTGAFEIHLDVGTISFDDLSISGGKVLAYHHIVSNESKNKYGYFVHDLATGENIDLPSSPYFWWPRFHGNSVVANVGPFGCAEAEWDCHPLWNPKVVLYDIRTGEMQNLGACCVVDGLSGAYDGDTIVLTHNEHILGIDFKGDGDLEDEFIGYATTLLSHQKPLLTNEEYRHPPVLPIDLVLLCSAIVAAFGLTVLDFTACLRSRRIV